MRLGLLLLFSGLFIGGCSSSEEPEVPAVAEPLTELKVLVRNAPGIFFHDRDGHIAGVEHDLVQDFAKAVNLPVHFIEKDSVAEILAALESGEAHMAAAGLTLTHSRDREFVHSLPYQTVNQQVVCRRGGAKPNNVAELVGLSIEVVERSSYDEQLTQEKIALPELEWKVRDASSEQLLEAVWKKQIDCTVADSSIVSLNRRYYPELSVRFDLTAAQPLVWYFSPAYTDLQDQADDYLRKAAPTGSIQAVLHRYYGFIDLFDYVDTRKFIKRIDSRYRKYQTYFIEAADDNNLYETLLAAQAYQESHWRKDAKSPTGVRGMMMLTRNTAKSLGVTNRLDPLQSIDGGARYLKKMKKRFHEGVKEPDLTWLALAAYNVGRAHLHDAQKLAREQGKNPHAWVDVKEVLPLLSDPKYYKHLKYGYARGTEPVRYVARIRHYQDILERELTETEN